jgi:hypothetical protein
LTATAVPADAAAAEARFLDELRRRVSWQAEAAAQQRDAVPAEPLDLLDAGELERLVQAHPDAERAAEWRAFLAELRYLADDQGRLPATLERLVRVVLADLLEA